MRESVHMDPHLKDPIGFQLTPTFDDSAILYSMDDKPSPITGIG